MMGRTGYPHYMSSHWPSRTAPSGASETSHVEARNALLKRAARNGQRTARSAVGGRCRGALATGTLSTV